MNGIKYPKKYTLSEECTIRNMKASRATDKEIAERLGRSLSSVKKRWSDMKRKQNAPPPSVYGRYGDGPIARKRNRDSAEELIAKVFSGELTEREAQELA